MTAARDGAHARTAHEARLDRMLGRRVLMANDEPVGRLEEFRAEQRGGDWVVTEYVVGRAGLFERLNLGVRLLFGLKRGGYLVAWDQLDISDPEAPRLTCSVKELRLL